MERNKIIGSVKNVGYSILGIGFFVGSIALFILFLVKGTEYAFIIYPYLTTLNSYLLFFGVPILLLMSFIRPVRLIGIMGLVYSSYVFGFSLWVLGFILTYAFWGFFGLIVGLVIAGVGVVPVAFLASIIHGQWGLVWNLLLATIATFGIRALGIYLAHRADKKDEERAMLEEKLNHDFDVLPEIEKDVDVGEVLEETKKQNTSKNNVDELLKKPLLNDEPKFLYRATLEKPIVFPESIIITAVNLDSIDFDKVIYCEITPKGAMGNEGGILLYVLKGEDAMITYEINLEVDVQVFDAVSERISQNANFFVNYGGGFGNYVYIKKNAQLEIDEKYGCFWYHSQNTKLKIDSSVKGVFLSVVAEMTDQNSDQNNK